jgi:hypothetical protein
MRLKIYHFFYFLFLLGVVFLGCSDSPTGSSSCDINCPSASRTGCECNDGTSSTATGSGACSGHGGVKCWDCK